MNSYFEQSGFYGQGGAPAAGDYRFPIGLGGLGGVSPYSQHQPRPPQDSAYDATPGSPSKAGSLYSSLGDSAAYRWVGRGLVTCVGLGSTLRRICASIKEKARIARIRYEYFQSIGPLGRCFL